MAEPRVQGGVEEVDDEVHRGEDHREEEHDALDQRQVAVDDGVDGHVAETLVGEEPLDDDGAADQEGELHADSVSVGRSGVGQRLAQDHAASRSSPSRGPA